jgi:hypothetical protein
MHQLKTVKIMSAVKILVFHPKKEKTLQNSVTVVTSGM